MQIIVCLIPVILLSRSQTRNQAFQSPILGYGVDTAVVYNSGTPGLGHCTFEGCQFQYHCWSASRLVRLHQFNSVTKGQTTEALDMSSCHGRPVIQSTPSHYLLHKMLLQRVPSGSSPIHTALVLLQRAPASAESNQQAVRSCVSLKASTSWGGVTSVDKPTQALRPTSEHAPAQAGHMTPLFS